MNMNANNAATTAKTTATGIKSACVVELGGALEEFKLFSIAVASVISPAFAIA